MIESYIESGKLASKIRDEASKIIKDQTLVIDLVEYGKIRFRYND